MDSPYPYSWNPIPVSEVSELPQAEDVEDDFIAGPDLQVAQHDRLLYSLLDDQL